MRHEEEEEEQRARLYSGKDVLCLQVGFTRYLPGAARE